MTIKDTAEEIAAAYDAEQVPIGAYVVLMTTYAGVFGLLSYATLDVDAAARPHGLDLVLLMVGSYKLSRVITMSFIGTPVRAPFTKRGKSLKGGEVQDQSRGTGLQKAIGNLLTCPFCFNVWAATAFYFGYLYAPALAVNAGYVLSFAAAGDVLHHAYRTLREKSE